MANGVDTDEMARYDQSHFGSLPFAKVFVLVCRDVSVKHRDRAYTSCIGF